MELNVEEALRQARSKVALLRFSTDSAASSRHGEPVESAAFEGFADTCEDIEDLLERIKRVLDADTLGLQLARRK